MDLHGHTPRPVRFLLRIDHGVFLVTLPGTIVAKTVFGGFRSWKKSLFELKPGQSALPHDIISVLMDAKATVEKNAAGKAILFGMFSFSHRRSGQVTTVTCWISSSEDRPGRVAD